MPPFIMRISAKFVARLLSLSAISMALTGCLGNMQAGDSSMESWSDFAGTRSQIASLQPPSASTIKKAQRQLLALGYDPGPTDGLLGKKTRIAIKHFQVDQEVQVDGLLSPWLAGMLNKASRRAAKQAYMAAGASGAARIPGGAGPYYEIGDAYVYTDGRVETVSRVGPEQTLWETSDGSAYTAYRNFILPPISWKSGSSKGENEIQSTAGHSWPPASAGDVVFSVRSNVNEESLDEPRTWTAKWRCVSGGKVKLDATAGIYEAIVIECERANPDPGTWKKRTWYFVPEIGHYVRRKDLIYRTGRKVTVDLVAIRPGAKGWPATARGGLDWAIQGALDSGITDKTIEWRSSAVGAMFNIGLKGNAPVSAGVDCRRYGIERVDADQVRHFPAIACKKAWQKRWLTPGLDPDSISPRLLTLP